MRIYLIGYMGAGKSSFGKKLAKRLTSQFIDLDQKIEGEQGFSISDLFKEKGEEQFRKVESSSLQAIESQKAVIATGGGCPCHLENMDFMNGNGITVYMEMSTAAAVSRLKDGRAQRPLLANLSAEELPKFVEDHLKSRTEFYKRAQIIVPAIDADLDGLVMQIQAR